MLLVDWALRICYAVLSELWCRRHVGSPAHTDAAEYISVRPFTLTASVRELTTTDVLFKRRLSLRAHMDTWPVTMVTDADGTIVAGIVAGTDVMVARPFVATGPSR